MKTLIGLALVANMIAGDFKVGNQYECGFKDSKPFMTLLMASSNMVMVNETMLFKQPDNNRLYIGVGAGDNSQMMIFTHENGELTIGGEKLQASTLKCKIISKPSK